MTDPAAIANRYIALWNETDPTRRRALLAEGWAENAAYVDPLAKGEGHEEISALIGAVQTAFPRLFVHARRPRRRLRRQAEVLLGPRARE
jgi:hypothetical protein